VGVRAGDQGVFFSNDGQPLNSIDFTLNGTDSGSVLLTGLQAGRWRVTKDGATVKQIQVLEEATALYLKSQVGTYTAVLDSAIRIADRSGQRFPLAYMRMRGNPGSRVMIEFRVSERQPLSVSVIDQQGEEIRLLKDAEPVSGIQRISWDGKNRAGGNVSPGVYHWQVRTTGQAYIFPFILLR
jgi:hypothetical protein